MSPGVNDGPRNTGTLPKSNRRSDRNRERSAANQQIANLSTYHGHASHSNNLLQLDWQPVSDRESTRSTKNSNTRSVSSLPSTSYQDISEFALHNSGRHYNYTAEDYTSWHKMGPPTETQSQSPPRIQGTKPTNVDKMPDRSQVESRLNQIRDYIRVTSTMMDSLNQSSDPRAQAQNEKLGRMVEDLHDSETKLAKLLDQYHNRGIPDESGDHIARRSDRTKRASELFGLVDVLNFQEQFLSTMSNCRNSINGREDVDEIGDANREIELRKKMEDSQRKLEQLQEHRANLVGMQLQLRERLNKAREAQQAFLQQDNQNASLSSEWESGNRAPVSLPNVEQLESETAVLRGKLAQLQNKKKHMDHLVAELQAVEISDRASCSSEGSRNVGREAKQAELEAMKAQLAHLKALMEEATRVRECIDSTSDAEPEIEVNGDVGDEVEPGDEEASANISGNLFDRQNDSDEMNHAKILNSGDRPMIEEIQAVTRELKEQAALLQAARAELQRHKQPLMQGNSDSTSACWTSTPPPSVIGSHSSEKKQSNNVNEDTQAMQTKKRQLEDLMRKEQSQSSSVNRDIGGHESNSQRGSNSHVSHTSTPANVWPPPVVGGSNEQSVDGISTSENLLDIGPQTNAIENGLAGNWWSYPSPPMNQIQHGTTEYYRQLLLGSQAQQLQMMGTTMQHCCQLLWAQQRELQSMRAAINQLQLQLRQSQMTQRPSNIETQEEHSNLSRSAHLGEAPDAALPPSSSLPNLVSLPTSSPALSHTPIVTSINSQQQQQLNNQVPPGNRANNYWDNFRSYSRQNLLSASAKTVTDSSSTAVPNTVSSGNTASGGVNSSIMKDKRNREHGSETNLPLPVTEAQYSLNLQMQSNLQERENTTARNILTSEMSQSDVDVIWEEERTSGVNDDNSLINISPEMKEVLTSLIEANKRRPGYLVIILREIKAISEDHRLRPHLLKSLRALQDTQSPNNPLNEATDQTASESCQSSDEDSEVGVMLGFNLENQSALTELATSTKPGTSSSPTVHVALLDCLEMPAFSLDCATNDLPVLSTLKPGYNEDLAEADQSRPESSRTQQANNEEENGNEQAAALSQPSSIQASLDIEIDLDGLAAKAEDERAEDIVLDRVPTRLYHH